MSASAALTIHDIILYLVREPPCCLSCCKGESADTRHTPTTLAITEAACKIGGVLFQKQQLSLDVATHRRRASW